MVLDVIDELNANDRVGYIHIRLTGNNECNELS